MSDDRAIPGEVREQEGGSCGLLPDPGELERLVLESSTLEGEPPERVLIAPWGEVTSANGSFVVDEESAGAAVEAFARHGTDLPIDYEHQTLGGSYASPSGQAPAAGWIKSLHAVAPGEAGEPGLYAQVQWTPAARERLLAREYRYLSPVILVRRENRRVAAIHSAALTNKPAIVGMRPIINTSATGVSDALEALRLKLGLAADAGHEIVLASASRRIEELDDQRAQREAGDRVLAAARAGKVPGNLRAWAMSLARKDPDAFDAWAASAPVVVAPGRTQPPDAGVRRPDRDCVVASARAVFRSDPALALITTEAAWVRDALREAGLGDVQV